MASIDDGVISQLEAVGAPEEVIKAAKQRAEASSEVYEVWEENWKSLTLFISLSTQWQVIVGMGGARRTGIIYASMQAAMSMQQIKPEDQPRLFEDLRLMERAALEVMNK